MTDSEVNGVKVSLKAYFDEKVTALRDLIEANDRRYSGQFESLEKLLSASILAQKEGVGAAFAASEKAIDKAEVAQTQYNARSNEFRATLDDQNRTMLPRIEADQRFTAIRELIDKGGEEVRALQRGESRGAGSADAISKAKQQSNWLITLVVTNVIAVLALLAAVALLFGKH
jgi:hypothetical protein